MSRLKLFHAALLLVLVIRAAGISTRVFGDEAPSWVKDLETVGYPTRLTENSRKRLEIHLRNWPSPIQNI
jgi:hypothetical protein